MNTHNFTTTLSVNQTPEAVFDAINNVRGWWSGEIEGDTDHLGSEFIYRYKDVHRSTQRITEFVRGTKIVWRVSDSSLAFVKDKSEWNDTEIVFDISENHGETEVRFYTPRSRTPIRMLRQLLERMGHADTRQSAQADRHGRTSAGCVRVERRSEWARRLWRRNRNHATLRRSVQPP
jgi:hypothetical protein